MMSVFLPALRNSFAAPPNGHREGVVRFLVLVRSRHIGQMTDTAIV